MDTPLRIAMVVPALHAGGMEMMVIGLSKELQARGHTVTIFCAVELGAFAPRAKEASLDVQLVPTLGTRTLLWPGALARALRDGRFDVMHSHSGVSAKAVRAARMAGVSAIVNTLHGFEPPLPLSDLAVTLAAAAQTHVNIGCSADTVAFFDHWFPWRRGRNVLVKNGIDLQDFLAEGSGASLRDELGIPAGDQIFGTVARLDRVKNQQLLIGALASLPVGWHLVMVGDGPLRESLAAQAESLGLVSRVHFAGRRSVNASLYQAFDVFALSSISEAMPMTILEAFAAGVPVVAPRVGGLPSLLRDGALGALYCAGDAPALAAAVRSVASETAATAARVDAAKKVVMTSHSLASMSDAYEDIYRRAMAHGR